MKFYSFLSILTTLSATLSQAAKVAPIEDASLPYGGVGIGANGQIHIGPIYNYYAAHKNETLKEYDVNLTSVNNDYSAWNAPSSGQQLVIYSCSSTTCGLSMGYSDVNPAASYVPIGFGMADVNNNVDFTPTAPVSQLNGRGGVSFGGAGQYHPEYFLYSVSKVAPQMVNLAKQNNANKMDIDLEQLSSIPPSYMIDLLTALHALAPEMTISVAPECPGVSTSAPAYVEGSGSVYNYWVQILNECPFLLVFIQSYNNWCSPYAYGSYDNLMQILSDWINPNAAIKYNGYNPKQIVLGLCAIEPEKDATACSFGYATSDVVQKTFLKANELYGCTVGGGVWASYCDKANNYLITNTMLSAFETCNGQTSVPSVAPTTSRPTTATPTRMPTTAAPTTLSPSANPTTHQPTAPTVEPTSNPTQKEKSNVSFFDSVTGQAVVGAAGGVLLSVAGYFGYKKYSSGYNAVPASEAVVNPMV